MVGQLISQSVS